ncbi:MAG: transposase [Sphingomonadaceae bacterium]
MLSIFWPYGFQPSRAHLNTLIASAGPDITARARWLVRNNGYAANAIESWAGNVVGAGIKPSSLIAESRLKAQVNYKNHVNADARYKLIRRYDVSGAAVHDSQKLDGLLNEANTSADVFADSAYRSAETEAGRKARGFRSRIHVRATRNHPLSQRQEEANRKKSRVRARIEHVFGAQETSAGSRLARTIGIVRARTKIGLQNLVYNIRRLVTLERMAAAQRPAADHGARQMAGNGL